MVEATDSVLRHPVLRPLRCQMLVNISNRMNGTTHLTSSSTFVTSVSDPRSTFKIDGGFARE